jgi:hypothetical protein
MRTKSQGGSEGKTSVDIEREDQGMIIKLTKHRETDWRRFAASRNDRAHVADNVGTVTS